MTVRLEIRGTDALAKALQRAGTAAQAAVDDAVEATALELRGDIVKRYQRGAKTGRIYQKYKPRRTHQASAPGQAPATDTGRLANSVVYRRLGLMTAEVSTPVRYGSMLEYGTLRIKARPAWRPAVELMRPKFNRRLQAALGRAIR